MLAAAKCDRIVEMKNRIVRRIAVTIQTHRVSGNVENQERGPLDRVLLAREGNAVTCLNIPHIPNTPVVVYMMVAVHIGQNPMLAQQIPKPVPSL